MKVETWVVSMAGQKVEQMAESMVASMAWTKAELRVS